MKKILFPLAAVAALTLLGCGDDDGGPTSPATPTADVRVAHLSPAAGDVDVWVDGNLTLEDVSRYAVSEYLSLPSGPHRIQVTPANQPTVIAIDAEVSLGAGMSYTVAAIGQSSVEPLVLVDDRNPAAQAKVRFVHASADAPAVDVALEDGAVLFGDVTYPGIDDDLSGTRGYLSVDAGTYDLEVRLAGTDTVVLPLPGTAIGGNATVFAIGLVGDSSLSALAVSDL